MAEESKPGLKQLPRNVWAVSATSFFMDVSTEMIVNVLPLFLANVLGVKTNIIGLIEGVAESTASILKLFSGWLSDKLGGRKWIAVAGYGISALAKPFFYVANTWGAVARSVTGVKSLIGSYGTWRSTCTLIVCGESPTRSV